MDICVLGRLTDLIFLGANGVSVVLVMQTCVQFRTVTMSCVVYDGGADNSILSPEREGQLEWNNERSNGSSNGM